MSTITELNPRPLALTEAGGDVRPPGYVEIPRYLHSTGQLHNGGPATGRFLQIVGAPQRDAEIPGSGYSFGTLIAAQAAVIWNRCARTACPPSE